jgi:uncharacterized phage protein (TIGR01671 family)
VILYICSDEMHPNMKREIKFRAFHKGTKKMILFSRCLICDEYSSVSFYPEEDSEYDGIGRLPNYPNNDGCDYDPFKEDWGLMQFTGLKDYNGKEIYEGDIVVQYPGFGCEFKPRKGVVSYKDASFWFDLTTIAFVLEDHDCTLEVIGNIYENPELLN